MINVCKLVVLTMVGVMLVSAVATAAEAGNDALRFSIAVEVEATDNRDATALEEDNVDFKLRPRLDSILDWGDTYIDFYYIPTFRYRTDPLEDAAGREVENEDEIYHDVGLNVDRDVSGNLNLRLRENYNYTDEPSIEEGDTVLHYDSSYQLNFVEIGANYQVSELSALDIAGRHMSKEYDEDTRSLLADEESYEAILTMSHNMSETLVGIGTVGIEDFTYEDTVIATDRGYTSIYGGVGVQNTFSPSVSASIAVGASTLEYEDSTLSDDSAPYAKLSILASTIPTVRLYGALTYMLRDSDLFPYSSQTYTDLYGKLDWNMSPSVLLTISGVYRLGEYEGDTITPELIETVGITNPDADQTTVIGKIELTYVTDGQLEISIAQQVEDLDSEDEGLQESYTRNSSTLEVTKRF